MTRKRKILLFATFFTGVIILSGISLLLWLRSSYFDAWVMSKVVEQLRLYGIETKFDSANIDLNHFSARIKNLQLRLLADKDPFFVSNDVFVQGHVGSLFRKDFSLDSIILGHPELHVDFDNQGKINLSRIKIPQDKSNKISEVWGGTALLNDGAIFVKDQKYKINTQIHSVHLTLSPSGKSQQWEVSFKDSQAQFQDKEVKDIEFSTKLLLNDRAIDISSLTLKNPLCETSFTGEVNWSAKANEIVSYNGNIFMLADLAKVSNTFFEEIPIQGKAKLRAHLSGDSKSYKLEGQIEPSSLSSSKTKLESLSADYNFESPLYTFSPRLKCDLNIGTVQYDKLELNKMSAHLTAVPELIEVDSLSTQVLGGSLDGKINIALDNSNSKAKFEFKKINLDSILDTFGAERVSLAAGIDGTADCVWPGLKVRQTTGDLNARMAGSLPNGKTFNAEVSTSINPSEAIIKKLTANISNSLFQAVGKYSWTQNIFLDAKFHSPELSEFQSFSSQVGLQLPFLSAESAETKIQLGGAGDFSGKISGQIKNPDIQGQVSISKLEVNDVLIGQLGVDFEKNSQLLKVKQAELIQPNQGKCIAKFDGSFTDKNISTLDLTLEKFRPTPIIQAVYKIPFFSSNLFSDAAGITSGHISLNNIPSMPVIFKIINREHYAWERISSDLLNIQGEGNINIVNTKTPYGSLSNGIVSFTLGPNEINFNQASFKLPVGSFELKASLDKRTQDYSFSAHCQDVNLTLLANVLRIPSTVVGIGTFDLTSNSNFARIKSDPQFIFTANSKTVEVGNISIQEVLFSTETSNGVATFNSAGQIQGNKYGMNGQVTFNYDKDRDQLRPTITAQANLNQTPISVVLGNNFALSKNVSGDVSGKIILDGPLYTINPVDNSLTYGTSQLRTDGEFSNLNIKINTGNETESNYVITNDGVIKIKATAGDINFEQCKLRGENTDLDISGNIGNSGEAKLGLNGNLNLKVLRTFSSAIYSSGVAHVKAFVTGNPKALRCTGFADIDELGLQISNIPVVLKHGGGRILFTANQAQIERFTADTNSGGKIELSGGAVLDTLKSFRWRLGMRGDNVRLDYIQNVRSLVDGELTLQGNQNVQVLSGNIKVKHAEYNEKSNLVTLLQSAFATPLSSSSTTSTSSSLTIDVNISAPDSLFIRNNSIDLVGNANLRLQGPSNDPKIIGRITVNRGQLEFHGDRYQVTRGIVSFPEARTEKVFFDIQAETQIRSYRVVIGFTGNPDKFVPVLRSEPSLPQPDILTLIATGDLPTNQKSLGTVGQDNRDTANVTAASNLLSALLAEKIEERTSRLLGINRFQLDPLLVGRGNNPTARLTVGRRINKDLSITYSANIPSTQEQIILVEYRIARNISIVGLRDQKGNFGIDVRVTKRF